MSLDLGRKNPSWSVTMGKRRNTAKTGDKALYKGRGGYGSNITESDPVDKDDDPMYNEVDRFHNKRDEEFLDLDKKRLGDDDDDDIDDGVRESVLDLGVDDSSDDSDDDDSENDDESDKDQEDSVDDDDDDDDSDGDKDSDDDEMDDEEMEDVRDWGMKKSAYYHGDTADLEIGQDEEDAYLEEEAAKEVQAARYDQMDEEDFALSEDDDGDDDDDADRGDDSLKRKDKAKRQTDAGRVHDEADDMKRRRDLSKMSAAAKKRFLRSRHPELLPLMSHFADVTDDWKSRSNEVTKALLEGEEDSAEVSHHDVFLVLANVVRRLFVGCSLSFAGVHS